MCLLYQLLLSVGVQMECLFSYGTLQQENVQLANFGRLLDGEPAILQGFIVGLVQISDQDVVLKSGKTHHPILQFTGNMNDEVAGTCFYITEQELAKADAYEVEEYTRIKTRTKESTSCWIYASSADVNASKLTSICDR